MDNTLEKIDTSDSEQSVQEFVDVNAQYYDEQFKKIGDKRGFEFTFNFAAFLLGSIWYGMRNLWAYFLPFVAIETMAVVQIARGIWGDLGAPFLQRLGGIEQTLATRREQLLDAQANAPDKVAAFEKTIASLERAVEGIKLDAASAQNTATQLVLVGIAVLIGVKFVQAIIANTALQRRYTKWRSDRTISSGFGISQVSSPRS